MRRTIILVGWMAGSALAADVPSAASAPGPVPVRTPRAAPSLVGVVSATQALDVLAQVEGRLESLDVHLGEHVEAGQLLASLDTRTRQWELASHQAQVRAAEAEHRRCALLLQQARQFLERQRQVRQFTAAEEYEKAQHAVSLAEADVALARARLGAAKAEASLARENLERTSLRAPFRGVVSEEYLQPGMVAGPTTPIVRLVSEDRLLRFAIPEAWVGAIRPGHEVWVRVEGAPAFRGVVERISPELDATSRQLKAEARLDLPERAREALPLGAVVPVEWAPPTPTGALSPGD
ncbi:efflux RND transporter periplasmic adaptor subunit [Melittangium boletus]|uniref:efflux RND transporter periplasmic adaptor subunit n=1 Tax=Melittangium boletus TaxID=83453 RepID=UPI003DA283D8